MNCLQEYLISTFPFMMFLYASSVAILSIDYFQRELPAEKWFMYTGIFTGAFSIICLLFYCYRK